MTESVTKNTHDGSTVSSQSSEGFPPQTNRQAEIETVVEFYRAAIGPAHAVYVSAPITSGKRFLEWLTTHQKNRNVSEDAYRREHSVAVIEPNREDVKRTLADVRRKLGRVVIDPTAVGDVSGWHQGDYRSAWARLIEEFADTVVFADGWQFSNGCAFEFWVAQRLRLTTVDQKLQSITTETGINAIKEAAFEMRAKGLDVTFMTAVLEELEGLQSTTSVASESFGTAAESNYKDEVLDRLATRGNVAQFVSFDPRLTVRFSRIAGWSPNALFQSVEEALTNLLGASPEGRINIRSYEPSSPKSREFVYGIETVEEAVQNVRRLAALGLHTIANETIDVNDGGVSGVALGDLIEFAPGDTPRAVEKPGVCRFPREQGLAVLQRVYGFAAALPGIAWRTEFSIHPLPRGYQRSSTVLWELEPTPYSSQSAIGPWPNRFSRFIGDKVFGLLVADTAGFNVPHTVVVARTVAPFSFGQRTGSGETWIRTCPSEPVPGKFTTRRGWIDPFELMAREDPKGTQIISVLAQDGIVVQFAGAAMTRTSGGPIVEGVSGPGDDFMVGTAAPQVIPTAVRNAVAQTIAQVESALAHPVKVEWAFDGERVWLLQLHRVESAVSEVVIVAGNANRYKHFDVRLGLDALRRLAKEAAESGDGIVLDGSVGVTSHFGDILRKAGVPSRVG